MEIRQRPVLALGLRLVAALCIATMFMLGKLAFEHGVALPEILFWRQVVTLPVLLGYLAATSNLASLRTNRIGSHAKRAGIGTVGMFTNFAAVTLLPLAEATTLNFTAPLFAVMIAALGVQGTGRAWPDLLVAAVMAVLALSGGWAVMRQAGRELTHTAHTMGSAASPESRADK